MNRARLTLAIETSNPGGGSVGVALGRVSADGSVHLLGEERLRELRRHDDDLAPAIERVCAGAGIGPSDLDRVAVSAGPGGYTATRMACAAGAMICQATGAEAVRVPTALVVWRTLDESVTERGVAVLLASKNGQSWACLFPSSYKFGDPVPSGAIVDASSLSALESAGAAAIASDRHLPVEIRSMGVGMGMTITEACPSAISCLGVSAVLPGCDAAELVPIYPREPDAVTQWRERHAEKDTGDGSGSGADKPKR